MSGSETLGSRAVPTQTAKNDENIGLRLDYGKQYEKDGKRYSRLNLQVNKGAENPTLKELANKNSHKVWATADILIEDKQSNPSTAAIGGAIDRELPVASGFSGQEVSGQARLAESENTVKQDLAKQKVLKLFEDLRANIKD